MRDRDLVDRAEAEVICCAWCSAASARCIAVAWVSWAAAATCTAVSLMVVTRERSASTAKLMESAIAPVMSSVTVALTVRSPSASEPISSSSRRMASWLRWLRSAVACWCGAGPGCRRRPRRPRPSSASRAGDDGPEQRRERALARQLRRPRRRASLLCSSRPLESSTMASAASVTSNRSVDAPWILSTFWPTSLKISNTWLRMPRAVGSVSA